MSLTLPSGKWFLHPTTGCDLTYVKKNGKNSSPVCYSANNQDDDVVDDDDSDCKAIIFIEE